MPWSEKYRPRKFEEVIGLPPQLPSLMNENIPNIFLYGPPGTGKTTIAKIIVKEIGSDVLILNASDERGIQTVRDKIKSFSRTMSIAGRMKMVLLDEMDYMTTEAQTSLRSIIEANSKNCRFIGTANYFNKIIPAIKSRFSIVELKQPKPEEIMKRLVFILQNERIVFSEEAMKKIIDYNYPDIRQCINTIQLSIKDGKLTTENIVKICNDTKKIWELVKNRKFEEIRKKLVRENVNIDNLIRDFEDIIFYDESLDVNKTKQILLLLAECNRALPQVVIKRIEFEDFILKVLGVLNVS